MRHLPRCPHTRIDFWFTLPPASVYDRKESCDAERDIARGMWMLVWIAMALQATPAGAAPPLRATPPANSTDLPAISILRPQCDPGMSTGEIVVCGRAVRGPGQRLERLDPRFERARSEDGLFTRRLSDRATLQGGGPKSSVGMTLRVGF